MKPYHIRYESHPERPWVLRRRQPNGRLLNYRWRRFASLEDAMRGITEHRAEVLERQLTRALGRRA